MEKEKLERYRSNKAECGEIIERLKGMEEDQEPFMRSDTINDYRTGKPRTQAIVGIDVSAYLEKEKMYRKRLKKLTEECREVEVWIEQIEDGMTRRIFRFAYLDGMPYKKIGQKVHLDKSNVCRKIDNYLKSQRVQQTQHYNKN